MKVSVWKVVMWIVIIALLLGGGFAIYRMGYAHGVVTDISFDDVALDQSRFDYFMPHGGMYSDYGSLYNRGHMGSFLFGRMFFGGLFFILIVGSVFRLFGMRRGYMHPRGMHYMKNNCTDAPPWMHHHPWYKDCHKDENIDDNTDASEKTDV